MWRTKRPTNTRNFASFVDLIRFTVIGFTIRKFMIKYDYDYKLLGGDLTPTMCAEVLYLLNSVMLYTILQRADINNIFYLRSAVCVVGHGNVLLQPQYDTPSLPAIQWGITGGDCEFQLTISRQLKLNPIIFQHVSDYYTKNIFTYLRANPYSSRLAYKNGDYSCGVTNLL